MTSNTKVQQKFVSLFEILIRKFLIMMTHVAEVECGGLGLWEGELSTRDENWKPEHSLQLVITNLGTFKVNIL